jgi:hypothetical protein
MEWKIEYREKDRIVFAKITGVMDWESHKKFATEVFPFAAKHNCHKVLIDFRKMTPSFTILQIDELPRLLREVGVAPGWRIAGLHDPKSPKSDEFDFFRNVAFLMSIQVKHFADKNEAIAWLKS